MHCIDSCFDVSIQKMQKIWFIQTYKSCKQNRQHIKMEEQNAKI